MATLFVSDLHLPAEPSPLREAFRRFLEGPAREADAVYILGDLFEHWIGDDVGLVEHAAEIGALAALTQRGVPVYFQHGNRDFLVGADFAALTGVELLADPIVVDLHGTPTLLSHGDIWCTLDVPYQRWRRFSRKRLTQAIYRLLPVSVRLRIAGSLRGGKARRRLAAEIMDVTPEAVNAAFALSGVRRLIHGHTHRPGPVTHDVGGTACERIVLPDWREDQLQYLHVDRAGARPVAID